MKRLFLLLAISIAATADARLISERDILRFQWVADPQLSPDGSQAAFVRVSINEKDDKYETELWLVETRAGAVPRRLTAGPRDSNPRWSPDGKTLAFLRAPEKTVQLWLLPMNGGEGRVAASMKQSISSIAWSPDGRSIAFTADSRPSDFDETPKNEGEPESDVRVVERAEFRDNAAGYYDRSRASHLFVVTLSDETTKPRQLTSGAFNEAEPTWSPDGSKIYFVSDRRPLRHHTPDDSDLFFVPAAGGEIVKVADVDGEMDRLALSPDGKWMAFRSSSSTPIRSYDQPDLFVVSTTPGSAARNLTAKFDNDVLGLLTGDQRAPRAAKQARPLWSSDGKTIFITAQEEGRSNLKRVDVASGTVRAWTDAKYDLQCFDIAGARTVGLVSSATIVGDLVLVDEQGATSPLTRFNDALFREVTITEPEELWYTSFDGKRIHAWVQKPPGFDATKKYPLILNIHGGPHAAYGWTFDHEFQWMAAKGYVVLYPNPRGSTTYGQDFGNIIQYRYPGDDHKDLMAGVDALISKGYIDPKKLFITGGSGGGLLTNWAITQTDRFVAAVSQRSIADWSSFWYTADFSQFTPRWFRKAPWQDPADYSARSPITFVEKIHTPLMLIEGEADLRTPPVSGGEVMFRALQYLKRPVVMVRFPGETHELSRSGGPRHRIERLQQMVGWFDRFAGKAE